MNQKFDSFQRSVDQRFDQVFKTNSVLEQRVAKMELKLRKFKEKAKKKESALRSGSKRRGHSNPRPEKENETIQGGSAFSSTQGPAQVLQSPSA